LAWVGSPEQGVREIPRRGQQETKFSHGGKRRSKAQILANF